MDLYAATAISEQGAERPDMLVRVLHASNSTLFPALKPLQTLSHPHIHPVLALEEVEPGGPLYLRSHFEARGSLARILETSTTLSFALLARIVQQIAEALHIAHERKLFHGHLKPENCLLTAPAAVQVGDFYCALLGTAHRNSSPPFVAPEQLQGELQAASDQFALAALAYLLLRQCSPLAARKGREWSRPFSSYVLTGAPEPLLAPAHPLDQVLQRALSREPGERFPDIWTFARFFASTLEQLARTAPQSLGGAIPRSSALSLSGIADGDLMADHSFAQPARMQNPRLPSLYDQGLQRPLLNNPSGHLLSPASHYQRRFPAQTHQNLQQGAMREQLPSSVTSLCLLPGHTAPISALCWQGNGYALVSGSDDGDIRLWTFQGAIGRLENVLQGHKGSVRMLRWSPDSSTVASASSDSALRIWDLMAPLDGPRPLAASWGGHEGDISALDWAPDGTRLASGGKDGTLRLWNARGEVLMKQSAHGGKGVKSLAWSPDRSRIASGGADQQIHLWDGAGYQRKASWKAHQDEVRHLQWSPNNQFLASAGGKKDTRVCLWDQAGTCLATIIDHQREVVGLSWSSDSSWLATCSTDGMLCFWLTDHLLEKRNAFLLGPPVTLGNQPQIMHGLPGSRMLAIATKTLAIEIFEISGK
jgi:serine/threonine protein kinase